MPALKVVLTELFFLSAFIITFTLGFYWEDVYFLISSFIFMWLAGYTLGNFKTR